MAVSRRIAVLLIGSSIGVAVSGLSAYAGGGRDTVDTSKSQSSSKKSQTKATLITQKNFQKLSPKGLKTLIRMIDSGEDARVEGFSRSFSRHLFETALTDKAFVVLLLDELKPLRTVKKRKDYLSDVAYEVENPFEDLVQPAGMSTEEFDAYIDSQETPEALNERKIKLRLLKKWRWAPRQGMQAS